MQTPKVAAIIQARMTSTRLPGKVMLPFPFPDGETLVKRVVRKLQEMQLFSHVVVATSSGEAQQPLVNEMQQEGIDFYQGDENHVLSRYIHIAKKYSPDYVVRITCDNPFIDAGYMGKTIEFLIESGADYTISKGLPYGMNMEVCKTSALLAQEPIDDLLLPDEKEHVTLRFHRDSRFKMVPFFPLADQDYSHIRVTVDQLSDYTRAALLIGYQQAFPEMGDWDFIYHAWKNYPYLFQSDIQ